MLALPILTDEARDSLAAQRHRLAYLSTEEARQIKRHALFADTFGALDRVALQRGLRHLDRKAVSQCLASGIENVAEMIFRSSPPGCGDTNIIKVSLDDEQVVVYASIEDGPVIFLPPAIPACGIERTLFVEAFALLMQLPFSLPSLADVYAYWGWTSDDVEVIRDWLPTVFQQADLSREQMARVIRQTARHSPMPQLESFDMTDKQDFFRLAREVVGAIENDEFLAFFQRVSRQAARQTPHRERLAVMVENVSRLQNADSIIFWTMFLDDLSQILTYHETHETALQQAQEAADMVGNDRLALLSDV